MAFDPQGRHRAQSVGFFAIEKRLEMTRFGGMMAGENSRLSTAAVLAAALVSALVSVPSAAAEGDAAAGAKKIQMCQGCHGIPGFRTAYPDVYHVPRLGGQSPAYIVAALKAYKAGDRNHPTMRGIAASLSDQDMADLAAYYSGAGK
jgi:cytochrome c553